MSNAPIRKDNDFIQSASVTAMMRALLSTTGEKTKNPDTIAKYYVSSPWKEFLDNPEQSRRQLQQRVPGCMHYHLVRTKKIDSSLLSWANSNPEGQIIILGSGFDSRSIRLKNELNNIRLFEFDLKGMLDYKKNIIATHDHLEPNKNVAYININFHEENILDKLREVNIQPNIPTYVLWEGVTYFLEETTVVETLANMANYFKKPLNIIFDYAYKDYIDGNLNYYGAPQIHEELKVIGEPHIFGISPEHIESFLNSLNYKIIDNSSAEELERQFLMHKDGSIISKIHGFHGIVECVKIDSA